MNPLLINKNKLEQVTLTVLFAFIFKGVLELACLSLMNDVFGHNYTFALIGGRTVETYILLFLSVILLTSIFYNSNRPSRIVFFIYFVFLVIPMLSIYSLRVALASQEIVYMVLLGFFIAVFVSQYLKKIHIPSLSSQFVLLGSILCLLMTIYVYACLLHSGALSRFNFNMYKVYEVRSQLNYAACPFMGYLLPWQAHVINMLFLVIGFLKRSRLFILIILLAQVILFGLTNFKSFLFAPFLVAFLYFFSSRRLFFGWLLLGSAFTVLVAWLFYSFFGEVMAPSIFIRRLFLVPADIHFWYYDFFSQQQNPFVFLSNSFLAPFSQYPYELSVPRLISWEYIGRVGGSNVGFLGDAYAHFGFLGIIFFSFVLGFFLHLLDSVTSSLPPAVSVAVIAIPSMALVNSALFTTFLTHGFVLAFLSLWVLSGWLKQSNPSDRGF